MKKIGLGKYYLFYILLSTDTNLRKTRVINPFLKMLSPNDILSSYPASELFLKAVSDGGLFSFSIFLFHLFFFVIG